jgi:deoxycytidine triphosphate deaminase
LTLSDSDISKIVQAKSMMKNINEERYIKENSLLIKVGLKVLTSLGKNAEVIGIRIIIKEETTLIVSQGCWPGVL